MRKRLTALLVIGLLVAGPAVAEDGDGQPMVRKATEASADRLLDENLTANPARHAQLVAEADAQPPAGAGPGTLSEFLYGRGKAAIAVGRQGQGIRDLRRAVELAAEAPGIDLADALYTLSIAESNTSRYVAAAGHLEALVKITPAGGQQVRNFAQLTQTYANLGDADSAQAAVERCRKAHQALGALGTFNRDPNRVMMAEGNLLRAETYALIAAGKFAEAEQKLRRVVGIWAEAANTRDTFNVGNQMMSLAALLRQEGKLAEAENEIRGALAVYQRVVGPTSQRTASALINLGRVLADQGRAAEGEELARRGIGVLMASGSKSAGSAHLVMADILAARYRWAEARAEFAALAGEYADDPQGLEALTRRNLTLPLALLKSGAAAEALPLFQTILEQNRASLGERAYATAETRGFVAATQAALGHRGEALDGFKDAVPTLVAGLADSDDDTGNRGRDQHLRLILEAYMATLTGGPPPSGIDPLAESFRLADAARGRSVLRALAASAARAAADNPALGEMARREQDAQKQIAALQSSLANAISARAEEKDDSVIAGLKKRIDALREQRAGIVAEIGRAFPDYARLLSPQPATLAEARAALRSGEAMIAFYVAEDRAYAWAVSTGGEARMATAPLGFDKLDATVKRLRQALDIQVSGIDEVPAFDLAEANRLYAQLLQPTEPAWQGARLLFVVPHGPLAQLPLALLPTQPPAKTPAAKGATPFAEYRNVPWLTRKVALAQLPSVGALATLRAIPRRAAPQRAFIAFADPLFSKEQADEAEAAPAIAQRGVKRRSAPAKTDFSAELADLPRLPDTAEEVESIGRVMHADPAEDLFIGKRASETVVRRLDLSRWRVVMFATHGLVPGDLAGLSQSALALSAPAVSGDGGSGLLTMERIMGLKLNADWVVLSACNTAAGAETGAEALSGLGRAFFYAGARALLVSNWPVETVSARLLTTDLFRRQVEDPTLGRAEALKGAMLALIDGPGPLDGGGKEQFSYAHPTFWAPFSLVGDGGGNQGVQP